MSLLKIKPHYKVVREYYDELSGLGNLSLFHEGAVSPAFASLLRHCANQFEWTLAEQFKLKKNDKYIIVDGALLDKYKLRHGVWEAKDSNDDLGFEIKKKFEAGYPKDNIIFQAPGRSIIWQDGKEVIDCDITKPENLIEALNVFFSYEPPEYNQWEEAVEEFKNKVPELAHGLLQRIEQERKSNAKFINAFEDFEKLCRDSINPNISVQALEEMLIQHLLTERIFRTVFDNPDFAKNNIIACEIEKVIKALTSKYFSRKEFLKKLDRFYIAIEKTATTISEYSQKQAFLNTVYENFFQGFSVKVADTHGIVYTPQPIVTYIVNSVNEILIERFDRSLSDNQVHILDPFVGTGNFIIRILRHLNKVALTEKYENELHCNEVLLLPYYISSMNIEHEYYDLTGEYKPYKGICLVDTFELAEDKQLSLFTKENTQRVNAQKKTSIFVIVGNPPYNSGQVNENDNNKNRRYPVVDKQVSETYGKASKAQLLNALNDPYVKAIRFASDRIGEEGIIAFVTNNSFIDAIAFDGMRKNLEEDFDFIYILDLGGNVRKNPRLSGTTHNVFGIQVGVSINLWIRTRDSKFPKKGKIYYSRLDEFWRKEQKYEFLNERGNYGNIKWKRIKPDKNYNWLKEGLNPEYDSYVPLGSKPQDIGTEENAIFKTFFPGINTSRDSFVYDFDAVNLAQRIEKVCEDYNLEIQRYILKSKPEDIDNFVDYELLKWSSHLKNKLKSLKKCNFDKSKIVSGLYRPFEKKYIYYDNTLIDRPSKFKEVFPNSKSNNLLICTSGVGSSKPFQAMATNLIPCYDTLEKTRCYPLYLYQGKNNAKIENITDWALKRFREQYKDKKIRKKDIFFYIYAILNHIKFRELNEKNLKREHPRIPLLKDFWGFVRAGQKLIKLHVDYEAQNEYPLKFVENKKVPLSWDVNKMKLSKDRSKIIYNDFLTIDGIPQEVFNYRLGNRSGLEWIIDQYQVKIDLKSGIVHNPNNADSPDYIVKLIAKVTSLSLKTLKIIDTLPELE